MYSRTLLVRAEKEKLEWSIAGGRLSLDLLLHGRVLLMIYFNETPDCSYPH
jgi:hypothetical protein